jgi:hypothetical protein
MAGNHARHAAESHERHMAELLKANAEHYRPGGARGEVEEAPEILANRGLFADSGGAYED